MGIVLVLDKKDIKVELNLRAHISKVQRSLTIIHQPINIIPRNSRMK